MSLHIIVKKEPALVICTSLEFQVSYELPEHFNQAYVEIEMSYINGKNLRAPLEFSKLK